MKTDLLKLCEIRSKTKFSLLYRGSRDGFGTKDFVAKCDGKAKTLTIVKSTNECIFGGYAEAKLNYAKYTGKWAVDPNAFLFSLINKENKPAKMEVVNQAYAISCHSSFAPVFGGGSTAYDLAIANDCNQNANSFSNLGNIYKHPRYEKGSESAKNFLAGSCTFQVAEIEVFQLN